MHGEESPILPHRTTEPPLSALPHTLAPAHLTRLLQDVLSIMNSLMEEKAIVQEDALLMELTDMVVILQEEAENLMFMVDLVEEYMEEVEIGWIDGIMLQTPTVDVFDGKKGDFKLEWDDFALGLDDSENE